MGDWGAAEESMFEGRVKERAVRTSITMEMGERSFPPIKLDRYERNGNATAGMVRENPTVQL